MTSSAPDHAAVLALAREGKSAAEIAVELNIPRLVVDTVVDRASVTIPRERPGMPVLPPWQIAPEHDHDEDARMLRLENRRRLGQDLDQRELDDLTAWFTRLQDMDGVVDYSPATGFTWVHREASDRDYVRRPMGA